MTYPSALEAIIADRPSDWSDRSLAFAIWEHLEEERLEHEAKMAKVMEAIDKQIAESDIWEYGFTASRIENGQVVEGGYVHDPSPSREAVEHLWTLRGSLDEGTIVRRRKAGPWKELNA